MYKGRPLTKWLLASDSSTIAASWDQPTDTALAQSGSNARVREEALNALTTIDPESAAKVIGMIPPPK